MTGYALISVPRRWCSNCVLIVITFLVGHTIPCRWPLRLLVFHDLTTREQGELARCDGEIEWTDKIEEIRWRLKW
jgi:hypothetical protein